MKQEHQEKKFDETRTNRSYLPLPFVFMGSGDDQIENI